MTERSKTAEILEAEFARELNILESDGLKSNPLRLEYERKVKELSELRDRMTAEGVSEAAMAKTLHFERRRLGEVYKDAAPPLFREYILYATEKRYGDPLGPDYEALRNVKNDEQIIESATRPIKDLDKRLTVNGFKEWFENVCKK